MGIVNGNQEAKDLLANIFWHYVKGNTTMYLYPEENFVHNVNFTFLEEMMEKIGWNQDTTFPSVASQPPNDALLRFSDFWPRACLLPNENRLNGGFLRFALILTSGLPLICRHLGFYQKILSFGPLGGNHKGVKSLRTTI